MLAYTVGFFGICEYNDWFGYANYIKPLPENSPEGIVAKERKADEDKRRRLVKDNRETQLEPMKAFEDAKVTWYFNPHMKELQKAVSEKARHYNCSIQH